MSHLKQKSVDTRIAPVKTKRKGLCYIAGPMRGLKHFNFRAFDSAAHVMRKQGWDVINPADMDRDAGFDPFKLPESYDWSKFPDLLVFDETVGRDLGAIRDSDAVFALDGWEDSKGAVAEIAVALWLGKIVKSYSTGFDVRAVY